MSIKISWLFLICLYFGVSESFSVESLPKCGIKDNECQKNLYQNMIKEVAKSGISNLNIPPLDPILLKNVVVAVLDVVNLTLVDGMAKGIKDCVINKFELDIEKGVGTQEIMCDLTVKGQYRLFGDSDFLKRILGGGGLRGEGKAKVKLEKLVLSMKYKFHPVKHDDGEIYLKFTNTEYDYDIKGKSSFAADNIFVGKENISEFVVKYLNENWKYVFKTFGKSFIDKAMEYYLDFTRKFFEGVPAKHFIIDDLTPYLKP